MTSSQGEAAIDVQGRECRPASPCNSVCTLDDASHCLGCKRTLAEISRWALMSAAEQWAIIDTLATRK